MEPCEIEAFWEDLLAYLEQQRVLPVLGAELTTNLNGLHVRTRLPDAAG